MKTARTLQIESLQSRLALSATTMETEPNDSQSQADAFTMPADGLMSLVGNSTSDKDKDYFTFVAPDSGQLQAVVDSPNGEFPQLEIETQASVKVLETQPNDNINSGTAQLQEGVRYYARVRAKDNDAAEYIVHLEFSAGDGSGNNGGTGGTGNNGGSMGTPSTSVAEQEPNDVKASGLYFSLADDGMIRVTGTSTSSTDRDYFWFVAPVSGQVNVRVGSPTGNPAALEVENSASVKLFETEPNDDSNSGSFSVEEGESYSFRLRSKDDSPADYQMDVAMDISGSSNGGSGTLTPPSTVANEQEPNDSKSSATVFVAGDDGRVRLTGSSESSSDSDYFRFVAPRTGLVSLRVNSTNGNMAALEVEDSNSVNLFETEPNDGINSGRFQVQEGESYSVRLRSKTDTSAAYAVDMLFRQAGDSDGDGMFNTSDLVRVMQQGKYRSDEAAKFEDGDWNNDGWFNESDFVWALQAGYFHP